MKKLIAQFMKFGVVGAIAFVIDYGFLIFFVEVFHIDYLISATLSFTLSVIFNYFASMRYVFTSKEGLGKRAEFLIFVLLSAFGLLLNNALMWLGVSVFAVDYRITKIVATVFVTLYNFITRKVFLDGEKTTQS